MSLDDFELEVSKIYELLPYDIKNRFVIHIEEEPQEKQNNVLFGYYTPLFPNAITLCYWGFKVTNDFRLDHIERVIKHEFEHLSLGGNLIDKHHEHKT